MSFRIFKNKLMHLNIQSVVCICQLLKNVSFPKPFLCIYTKGFKYTRWNNMLLSYNYEHHKRFNLRYQIVICLVKLTGKKYSVNNG